MYRYVAFAWNRVNSEHAKQIERLASMLKAPRSGLSIAYDTPGLLVAHFVAQPAAHQSYPLANHSGVIIGCLFRRHDDDHTVRQVIEFDDTETNRVLRSRGQHIVDNYWGAYLLLTRDERTGSASVLRDPTATLPCFHTQFGGISALFSHVEDCLALVPKRFSINKKHLAAYLLADQNLTRECTLNEIEDIPGGERVTLLDGTVHERESLWNPATFCNDLQFDDERLAEVKLRSVVQTVVSAWASCYPKIVHRLSGGLDSSIIACCLSQAPSKPSVTALNFFVEGTSEDTPIIIPTLSKENLEKVRRIAGHADERKFARLVAQRCGYPLVERERLVPNINFEQLWMSPMATRPSKYVYMLDMDEVEIDLLKQNRARALLSGLAGDTVFYCTLRALGAIDYAYCHSIGGAKFLRQVSAATSLTGESFWRVLRKAIVHGSLKRPLPPVYQPLKQPHLLHDEITQSVTGDDLSHPWLQNSGLESPGKRDHVKSLAHSGLFYPHVFHSERYADAINPLTSQPIVELCLRIPSYVLLAGGISRGLARRAFSDLLPPEVTKRTVKGLPNTFWEKAIRTNMRFVREALVDGALVAEGFLDRDKTAAYLTANQVFLTVRPTRIMTYLSAEAWLRQWTRIRYSAVA
jgi:asparagine synthase (glutamine-hydrolysing)